MPLVMRLSFVFVVHLQTSRPRSRFQANLEIHMATRQARLLKAQQCSVKPLRETLSLNPAKLKTSANMESLFDRAQQLQESSVEPVDS